MHESLTREALAYLEPQQTKPKYSMDRWVDERAKEPAWTAYTYHEKADQAKAYGKGSGAGR